MEGKLKYWTLDRYVIISRQSCINILLKLKRDTNNFKVHANFKEHVLSM